MYNNLNGWLIIDKQSDGKSSNYLLGKVRRLLKAKKAGYVGTLDPLASGVLPIALNEATKAIHLLDDSFKSYSFTVNWGSETTTDDMAGEIINQSEHIPKEEDIKSILNKFTGSIEQTPPDYSAIKINGRRACDIVRRGQTVQIPKRTVLIKELTYADGVFYAHCSKGTYIRSLAKDIGRSLNTFAHIKSLKREKVGNFSIENAISLAKLEKIVHKLESSVAFVSIRDGLGDILAVKFDKDNVSKIRNGCTVCIANQNDRTSVFCEDEKNQPLAIGNIEGGMFIPKRIFNITSN